MGALAAAIAGSAWVATPERREADHVAFPDVPRNDAPREPRARFSVRGVQVTHVGEPGQVASLSARAVLRRGRVGMAGIFVYHDVDEVVVEGVEVVLPTPAGVSGLPPRVVGTLGGMFSLGDGEESHGADSSLGLGVVTRIVFQGFGMKIPQPGGQVLSIDATRGRLNFDSSALVLEGDVVVSGSRGETFASRRVVLSDALAGLVLPDGYTSGGRAVARGAYLTFDADGTIARTSRVPEVDTGDFIEEKERIVLAHLADTAPPAARGLLLALLSQTSH